MGYILAFFIGALAGIFLGVIILASLTSIGSSKEAEEAYHKGVEDGKKIALNKIK